ncbi:alpha/beta fold hydrolase [bacterium]|nr:alpha/beta fold hydrolase [bacterium]
MFILILLFLLSACNSVFYQPDSLRWTLPEDISPKFEILRISVGEKNETLEAIRYHSRVAKKGTIVHFHGNAQNMSAHVLFVAWLLDEGFDVLTFDYRGYGRSDGRANRLNTIEDGQAVLNWLAANSDVESYYIVAQSLGGAVALGSLNAMNPVNFKKLKGLVVESTFSSYRGLAQRKLASFFLTWPLQWPLSFLVSDEFSPAVSLTKISARALPTLVIHGTLDPVVPFSEGLALAELMTEEKIPVTLHPQLGRGHTACFIGNQTLLSQPCKQQVMSFLTKNMASRLPQLNIHEAK